VVAAVRRETDPRVLSAAGKPGAAVNDIEECWCPPSDHSHRYHTVTSFRARWPPDC
jgi:hypothetical protein